MTFARHRREEDLHIICTRSASLLRTCELRCWMTVVTDHLNQPTSLEFIKNTAYGVTGPIS